MVIRATDMIGYQIAGAYQNQAVPSTKVGSPAFPEMVGVDGRLNGCLSKFYGMRSVLATATVSGMANVGLYGGPSWFKPVAFRKKGASTTITGFLVRWDSGNDTTDEQVDLLFSTDGGSTFTKLAVWATGNSIDAADVISADVYDDYLYVSCNGLDPKTIYWSSGAGTLVAVDMGAGDFATALAAPTKNADSLDSDYYLKGNGVYQIAYRFYDSTRNIYSAMSDRLTVTLDRPLLSKASGYITFNSSGGDSGKAVDGDVITIGGRTYEADSNSVYTGDVQVDITGLTTISDIIGAFADAINGDASATVSARAGTYTLYLEALDRGSDGNSTTISVTEVLPNQNDLSASGTNLTGGGEELADQGETNVKVTIDFPANTAVVAGEAYADFSALFDTVEIFRSITLGLNPSAGAVLYYESEVAMPGTSGAWDSLTADVGSQPDDALPFGNIYDPETDIVTSPPASGVLAVYQGQTFMASADSDGRGIDLLHSSIEHASPEYFSTYNRRKGTPALGKNLQLIPAGDSLFAVNVNGVVHIHKAARERPLVYADLHRGRGIPGFGCAHAVGNSVIMASEAGLMILSGTDGNMGQVNSADRIIYNRWRGDLATISSGFDAVMNTSYFLHPGDEEILCIFHGVQGSSFLKGANFVWCSEGLDIAAASRWRAFFITATGLIVSPDYTQAGSGTMWDLDGDSYTLQGTVTDSTSTTLTDSAATFHSSFVGALVYMTSGTYAGQYREITSQTGTQLTFTSFGSAVSVGDTYAISPVPWEVRLPRLWDPDPRRSAEVFKRWLLVGVAAQFTGVSGFTNSPNDHCQVGAYRHGSSTEESGTGSSSTFNMGENPATTVAAIQVDGISVEPFLRQISVGTTFELTEVMALVKMTDSEKVSDNAAD